MEKSIFSCECCEYKTKRRYDLKRHQNALHFKEETKSTKNEKPIILKEKAIKNDEKAINFTEKAIQNDEKAIHSEEKTINENKKILSCIHCKKKYKTTKYLISHEKNCKGINKLTCPRCMKTFSSSGNKCKHIKKNNCKAKSIIYANNGENQENKELKQSVNINGNNNNNTINNNFIINNYGSERTDYITFDEMINILTKSGNNIIPKYIEFKHFNKDFPENNNIKYEKNNGCLIKKNNEWKITDINYLSKKLIDKNALEINK